MTASWVLFCFLVSNEIYNFNGRGFLVDDSRGKILQSLISNRMQNNFQRFCDSIHRRIHHKKLQCHDPLKFVLQSSQKRKVQKIRDKRIRNTFPFYRNMIIQKRGAVSQPLLISMYCIYQIKESKSLPSQRRNTTLFPVGPSSENSCSTVMAETFFPLKVAPTLMVLPATDDDSKSEGNWTDEHMRVSVTKFVPYSSLRSTYPVGMRPSSSQTRKGMVPDILQSTDPQLFFVPVITRSPEVVHVQ